MNSNGNRENLSQPIMSLKLLLRWLIAILDLWLAGDFLS